MKINTADVATLWAIAYIAIILHGLSTFIGSALEIGGAISIIILLFRFVRAKFKKT
jgi:hypothetical protein